jgi:sodium/pantothenate symporter
MLMVGLAVIGLALLLPRNIYWLTHFAGPLFASSWGVVAFMSIWSGRLTEAGAFWGMVAGLWCERDHECSVSDGLGAVAGCG